MSAPSTFRSALNGFNREDVVKHLEYLNTRHIATVNQLKTENEALLAELEALRAGNPSAREADCSGELAQLRARVAELEAENEALKVAVQAQPEVRDEEAPLAAQAPDRTAEELEIYRRAERVEREARERATLVYQKANSALADASVQVDAAVAQINEMADKVSGHLASLQRLVTDSKRVLDSAAVSLAPINPDNN